MTDYFDRIKKLFNDGLFSKEHLSLAVKDGLITKEESEEILTEGPQDLSTNKKQEI